MPQNRYICIFTMYNIHSNFSSINIEAIGKLEDLREEEKCNIPMQNKDTSHFFNAFNAMGVSLLSRSVTSDQITSHFINFSVNFIFSDFPRVTTW